MKFYHPKKVILTVFVWGLPILLKYNLEADHNGGGSYVTERQDQIDSKAD
jgi:hypothetical protein